VRSEHPKEKKLSFLSIPQRGEQTKRKNTLGKNAFNFFGFPITTCPKSATVAVRFFLPVQFNVFFWLATQIED